MTMKQPDWDWVGARRACSSEAVFESLRQAAKRNVDAMMTTISQGNTYNAFHFVPGDDTAFGVGGDEARGVRFSLADHEIIAESNGLTPPIRLQARVVLSDDGECRLAVNDRLLQEWQFLKLVLEPLFFDVHR